MNKLILAIFLFLTVSVSAIAQNIIGGIGAQLFLDTVNGFTMPRIMSLVPGSPAYDTLKATDYIMSVNGVSCKDKTIEEVVSLIRGEAGTKVHIKVADTKQGVRPREYDLTRVSINTGAPADPIPAFNSWCDEQAKQLKKKGFEIIKTFNSDCGNYFFNFNAESGGYRVQVYTMEDKGSGTYTPGFTLSAKVYDGNNEAGAVSLNAIPPVQAGNTAIAQSAGTITFSKDCVGVVGITITNNDAKKCKAMFVTVYR